MGQTICYDVRFPHLYRDLSQAGAEILFVPAAFTQKTGKAHWHVLNRARAIENGAFVVAPCAIGKIDGGGASYGHSLIINPWGEVLADGGVKRVLSVPLLILKRSWRRVGAFPA
jgi:predicted amidohydrolase|tara:strand:+ start:251 stop:592 length:342 start_codon:yes stop_codon:yes gene_type:complete